MAIRLPHRGPLRPRVTGPRGPSALGRLGSRVFHAIGGAPGANPGRFTPAATALVQRFQNTMPLTMGAGGAMGANALGGDTATSATTAGASGLAGIALQALARRSLHRAGMRSMTNAYSLGLRRGGTGAGRPLQQRMDRRAQALFEMARPGVQNRITEGFANAGLTAAPVAGVLAQDALSPEPNPTQGMLAAVEAEPASR